MPNNNGPRAGNSKKHYLRYHIATPSAANKLIIEKSPLFNENWQTIPTILSSIVDINNISISQNKEWVDMPYEYFKDKFQSIKNITVKQILDELIRLGILERNLDCVFYYNAIGKLKGLKGQCSKFRLTALGIKIALDDVKEYYFKTRFDKKTIQKVKKSKRDRKVNEKVYDNPVLQYQNDLLDNIEFDYDKIDDILDKETNDAKKCFIYRLIIQVTTHTFKDLKFNEKDGRMWNVYTALPLSIKECIKINGLSTVAIFDMANSYLSCLGEYSFKTYYGKGREIHTLYDGVNPPAAYLKEKTKWNNIFLNPNVDAKDYIGRNWLHSSDKEEIKKIMIRYINGYAFQENKKTGVWSPRKLGKNSLYTLFGECFEREFPLMYKNWRNSKLDETGPNIGKMYESILMLDPSLYNKADELGVVLAYEYDGCSIFAKDTTKISEFLSYLESRSLELLGFQVIFKNKLVDGSVNDGYTTEELVKESMFRQLQANGFMDSYKHKLINYNNLVKHSWYVKNYDKLDIITKELNTFEVKNTKRIGFLYINKKNIDYEYRIIKARITKVNKLTLK